MSSADAGRPGNKTSEWVGTVVSMLINLMIALFGGVLAQWGIVIDPEVLIAAILANTAGTGAYSLGRSGLKKKALEEWAYDGPADN